MKLSDAILLGSTVVAPKAGGQHFAESDAGCALGMAAIANGRIFRRTYRPVAVQERRTLGAEGVWGDWVLRVVARPCKCWAFRVPREMRIKDIVAHLFDRHVMTKRDWTLENLVSWVKTVEPSEENEMPARAQMTQAARRMPPAPFAAEGYPQTGPCAEDLQEWQAVQEAFTAKHDPRRRRV